MEHRNGSAAAIVIGLIAVVVVGLGVFYVVSDPFSTSVDSAFEGATEWTSENIQANPVGYLSWAGKQVEKTENDLKTSELSLTTNINKAKRKMEKAEAEISTYQAFVDEAIAGYKKAKKEDSFPVMVRGQSLDEPTLKKMTVEASTKLKASKDLKGAFQKMLTTLDKKLTEVKSKQTEVMKMKVKLESDLEIAKTNKTVDGIEGIGDRLGAIMDTSQALAGATTDAPSLDSMLAPSGEQQVDTDFEALLSD